MESRREVAVFVTRREDAEVLLLHRSPDDGAYWHIVAGAIDAGEAAEEAAARELFEETRLVATIADGMGVIEWANAESLEPVADPSASQLCVGIPIFCYRVGAPDDWEPVLNVEHDDYRWCAPDEAARLLRWPQTARALQSLVPAGR